jgi:hypothetical protein
MTIKKMNRVRRRWARRVYGIAAGTAMLGLMALAVSLLVPGTVTPATAAKGGVPGPPRAEAPVASTLTGRITGINISKSTTAYGAPVGISSASVFSPVDTLSPDVTVTPSNLSVRINTTATTGLLVGLTWGSSGFFTCSVNVGTASCTNSSSGASIPPGTEYSVFVTPGTTSFTGDVLFGYQLTG